MADGAKPTGFFRGAGGSIFEMDLPLSEVMADQQTRGQLVRVNADGSPYEAPATDESDPVGPPSRNALKNEWVGYAVSQGISVDDADAMTKNDLIEKFGGE